MCKNLTDIYCYATTPPTINHSNRFKSQTNISNGTLYVPRVAQNYIGKQKVGETSKI